MLCLLSLKKKHSLSSSSSLCFKILWQALLLQQFNHHLCLLSQSSTLTWLMQSCEAELMFMYLKDHIGAWILAQTFLIYMREHREREREIYIKKNWNIELKYLNSCIVLLFINYFLSKGYWTSWKSVLIKFRYVKPTVSALRRAEADFWVRKSRFTIDCVQ